MKGLPADNPRTNSEAVMRLDFAGSEQAAEVRDALARIVRAAVAQFSGRFIPTVQIFLSYAREDRDKVESLYQRLSDAGFQPWMDTKDIAGGEDWNLTIHRAVRQSHFFLACLSPHSVKKRGFVQRETKEALDIWLEKLDNDIYLIPVRLEKCDAPVSLSRFQWVDLFADDGWTRLMKALQEGIKRRAEEIQPTSDETAQSDELPERLLSAFPDERQATDCAIAILQQLHAKRPEFEIHPRVSVTCGDSPTAASGFDPKTFHEAPGGMSRAEIDALTQDFILLDKRVAQNVRASRGDLLRFVGMNPKSVDEWEGVYLLDWQRAEPIQIDALAEPKPPESAPVPRVLKPNQSPPSRFELRGMDWYEEADAAYLHGRDEDVKKLRALVVDYPVVRLTGPSGVGKSSVLRAGLLPTLRRMGWRAVVVRPFGDPARTLPDEISRELLTEDSPQLSKSLDCACLRAELASLLESENCKCLVLLIDQIEDILSPYAESDARATLTEFLREIQRTSHLTPMLKAVVAYRTDTDARLGPLWQEVGSPSYGLPYHPLMGITRDVAATVIREAAGRRKWTLHITPESLSDLLVAESRDMGSAGEVYPPYLQIILTEADALPDHHITEDFLSGRGGMGGIVGKYLENTLKILEERGGDWAHCRKVLEALCRTSGEKASQTENEIAAYARLTTESIHPLLNELVRLRLARPLGGGQYEVQHDRLAAVLLEGMKDADREFKEATELLATKTTNYPRTHELLTQSELQLLYTHRRQLSQRDAETQLILKSILTDYLMGESHGLGWFWFANASFEVILSVLRELIQDKNVSIRQAIVEVIGRQQHPSFLPLLRHDKDKDMQQAALAAISHQHHPDALPLLRELAYDASGDVRLAAVRAMGYQQHTDLRLLRRLAKDRDEDEDVRCAAIEAIGRQQRSKDLPLLWELADEDDPNGYVMWAAIEAIGQHQHPDALPLLQELVDDRDNYVRLAVAEAIGEHQHPNTLSLLRELAEDIDQDVQRAAIEAIGQRLRSEDLPLLRKLALDEDWAIRRAAAEAIGRHQHPKDLPLLRKLVDDDDEDVQRVAAEAIGQYKHPDALIFVRKLMRRLVKDADEDKNIWQAVVRVIGRHQRPEDLPLLRELARHGNKTIQLIAIEAIGDQQHPDDLPLLRALVNNINADVRRAAVQAIERQQHSDALPLLRKLARDQDADVRRAAVKAIGQHQRPDDWRLLRELADDRNEDIRRAAVEAIGRQQHTIALSLLRELAHHKDKVVRRAAVEAIGQQQHPTALSLLHKLARDINADVRQAAVEAIGRYHQTDALSLLRELARDADKAVRQAAVQALIRCGSREELEGWLDASAPTLSFDVLSTLDYHLYCPAWWKEAEEKEVE